MTDDKKLSLCAVCMMLGLFLVNSMNILGDYIRITPAVISYLLLLLSEMFIAGKNIPQKIFFQNTIMPMLLGLPSFVIFMFALKKPLKTWYELIFAILIFGFIYLIFFVIYMAATHTIKFRKNTKSN